MGLLGDVGDMFAGLDDGVQGLFHDLFSDGPAEDMAGQLMLLAEQVERLGRQLLADAEAMSWQGEAAGSFREHTASLSQQFAAISDELRDAAGLAGKLI
jgi:hypothetical protein